MRPGPVDPGRPGRPGPAPAPRLRPRRPSGRIDGGLCWRPSPAPGPRIDWGTEAEPVECSPQPRIDLATETGLRVWARVGGGRTVVWVQFHHACCDVLGLMQFVGDWLVGYAGGAADAIDPYRALATRDRSRSGWWRWLLATHWDAKRLFDFYHRRPAPLASRVATPNLDEAPAGHPASASDELDPDELGALLAAAKRAGCTLNDLLLRDAFLAFADWNRQTARRPAGSPIRVGVPLNLRPSTPHCPSAANIVGMVFLDRFDADVRDSDRLLVGIGRELREVKGWNMGLAMARALKLAGRVPGGMARLVPTDRCLTTAILSNAGRVLADLPVPTRDGRVVSGNLVLEQVRVFPAARPWTWAVIQVLTYASRLDVTLGFNRNDFCDDEAEGILGLLTARFRASAATAREPVPSGQGVLA